MTELRRRAYLDALGIDVWLSKPVEADHNRLIFSPGKGDTLLVCSSAESSITRLAGDITRALGGEVIWAWPDPEGRKESPTVAEAVGQFLFTRVVIFGSGLGRQMFDGDRPEITASTSVLAAPDLDELAEQGTARQLFWKQISGSSAG